MTHRVWAEINMKAMEANCRYLAKIAGGTDRLMAILKANAYGHGAAHTLEAVRRSGLVRVGVGDSHEALELRQLGWPHQILVLGSLIDEEIISIINHKIALAIHSLEKAQFLASLTTQLKKSLEVHLKIDSGMRRLGTGPEKVREIATILKDAPYLKWKGVMTHFAHWDDPGKTQQQLKILNDALTQLDPLPPDVEIHAAATEVALSYPETRYDFIRSGLGIYGLKNLKNIQPVLSLYSQVIFIKDVPQSAEIGYGGAYSCSRPTRIAIFPMGYSDGLRLNFFPGAHVLIRGQKAPIIGKISMDYSTVDITEIPHVQVGDTVTLIGSDKSEKISVDDWSRWAHSNHYEITCLLGNRVQRVAIN